jgi:hypothetical protein
MHKQEKAKALIGIWNFPGGIYFVKFGENAWNPIKR